MYPISAENKERFLSGQRQVARLTVSMNKYEPYKVEVFSTQLSVEGENIFTRENETDGKHLNSSGGYTNNTGFAVSDYLEIEPQKRYVIVGGEHATATAVYHAWYDENETFIRSEQWNQEFFISPSNAKYLRVSYRTASAPTSVHIEVGIVPHGTVDVATGVLSVDYANISDLSYYNYVVQSDALNFIFRTYPLSNMKQPETASERLEGIASSGYRISLTTGVNNSFTPYSMLRNSNRLYFRNDDYAGDVSAFQSSMSGIQAIYELENPCVYQLTSAQVTTLLNENNIWADSGDISVTYRTTAGTQKTESGSLVHITDGANNIPVTSLPANIKYTQDLNGYDYPWVGGGGKNKAELTTNTDAQYMDVDVYEADDIEVTNISSGSKFGASFLFNAVSGTSYTFSVSEYTENGANVNVKLYLYSDRLWGNRIIQFNIPSNTHYYTWQSTYTGQILVGIYVPANVLSKCKNFQIEQGSSATTYAPYENICPIEGWEEVKVTRTGKNLIRNIFYFDSTYLKVFLGDESESSFPVYLGEGQYTMDFKVMPISGLYLKTRGEFDERDTTIRYVGSLSNRITFNITKSQHYRFWLESDFLPVDPVWFDGDTVELVSGTLPNDIEIEEDKIIDGGLSVNRYCTTSKSAMIGSCVASEMDVILNNESGEFNDVNFIGKDIKVEVGTLNQWGGRELFPLGIFQVDESPKKLEHISLTTLDRMMLLEKNIEPEKLSFPTTVIDLYNTICNECGVTKVTTTLFNGNYVIEAYPDNVQTYRDLLSCICEISGTCAFFDWNGELRLEWFSQDAPTIELTTANRTNSDLAEESVQITGVEVKAGESTYLAGTDEYTLSVAQNPLVTHDEQELADSLYQHLGWLAYRPFTATVLPMPYIYPMDMATFTDRNGNQYLVAITDWTFRLNRNTELRGRGESSQQASFKKKYGIGENGADLDEALGILRETIIKNAEIINQQMETIERTLHGEYEALSSEFGSYRNETDAKITANAEGITQAYTNIEEIDSKYGVAITDTNEAIVQVADGAVATNTKFREVTEAYIKSGKLYYEGATPVYGVAVGQLTYETVGGEQLIKRSGVYSVFTSEELAFYIDDVKVAYMKNKKLYINEAEFVSAIKVGRYKLEDGSSGFTIKYGG